MVLVGEIVAPATHPRGPAEIVEGDGVVAHLGKPQGEFFIERVETPHVRQYDDAGVTSCVGIGLEYGELVPVRRSERAAPVTGGGSFDRPDRWMGI
jgi:hypothetical protein